MEDKPLPAKVNQIETHLALTVVAPHAASWLQPRPVLLIVTLLIVTLLIAQVLAEASQPAS